MKKHKTPSVEPRPFFDESGVFHFRPVSSDARKALRLQSLTPPLVTFFEGFQSSCALDCCGLCALAFKSHTKWEPWNFDAEVFKWLENQREQAEAMEADVIRIPEFLQPLYTDDWLFLLRHLMENMKNARQWR